MTTIAEVAARAGVGVGTVSRVLNGGEHVRPETRARVEQAMAELSYERTRRPRRAQGDRGGVVAVVGHFSEGSSAYQRVRGIVSRLQPLGFEVVLHIVDHPERAHRRLMELPSSGDVDGMLVLSLPIAESLGEELAARGFPTVLVDTHHRALPSVTIDDRRGGEIATNHLIGHGHRRIAFIGEPPGGPFGFTAAEHRERGYEAALARAGLPIHLGHVKHGAHQRSAARQLALELFANAAPPTGVVVASDLQAIGVLEAMRASGRAMVHDVSVVGFDDIELASMFGLSTVRQPLELSGQRGADLLYGAIVQGASSTPFHEVLPLELVVRHSSGPAPDSTGAVRRPTQAVRA
jgi:DNA-binding LacI/PurR family transcriptional regulator